jgi:hypothetical protein
MEIGFRQIARFEAVRMTCGAVVLALFHSLTLFTAADDRSRRMVEGPSKPPAVPKNRASRGPLLELADFCNKIGRKLPLAVQH